ncbi:MAG: 23S rRNA (uracil(1939)-C(5))-methyltransferase RlmD [Vibrionaceae bacterium]
MARFFKPEVKKIDPKHLDLQIIRFDHHGDGIAFIGKKPVFVAGALPNETVRVQLIEDKRQFARGKLIKVLQPAENRVAPRCQHYGQCGGCNMQHLTHASQCAYKQQALNELVDKFMQAAKPTVPAGALVAEPWHYRRRARLSVKLDKAGLLHFGFRKRNSAEIVSIRDCPVLAQSLNALLTPLSSLLSAFQAKRAIGHIELAHADNALQLLVRTTQKLPKADEQLLVKFCTEHALHLYLKQMDEPAQRFADEAAYYQYENLRIEFEPQDFIQINGAINQQMVATALQWLSPAANERVLDLFCGLGNFSLPLAARCGEVIGVEGVAEMVERATANAKRNGLDNARFFHSDLSKPITESDENNVWADLHYDKILLDPARAGALEAMPWIARAGATKIVYVSCHAATLARDSQVLLENGYKLKELTMLDMFAHTAHLEAMALFTK